MFVRVNIEEGAWTDRRFAILANVLGFADAHHALIKCAALWSWQTDNYSPESPTHVVDADTIDACLERTGAGPALVRAKLAEETPDGFRIKGSEGRIEWLWKCRRNARKGGEAKRVQSTNTASSDDSHPASPVATPMGAKREQDNKEDPPGLPPGKPLGDPPGKPSSALLFSESPSEKRQSPKATAHAVQVIAHWRARFAAFNGTASTPSTDDRRVVDTLLKTHPADEIRRRIDFAFDTPPDFPKHPYPLATFAKFVDKFIRPRSGPSSTAPRPILTREQRDRAEREAERTEETA